MSLSRFVKSFKDAFQGLSHALSHEQNFCVKLTAGFFVLVLMFLLNVATFEKILLSITVFFVLSLELVNTAVEHLSDLVEQKWHEQIKTVKDLMAAAVLIASVGAAAVGLLIFYPYLIEWL